MSAARSVPRLSVSDLGTIALAMTERAAVGVPRAPLAVRSLRLKPGRSLTMSCGAREARRRTSQPLLSMTVGAEHIDGAYLRFDRRDVDSASLQTPSPGVVVAPDLGLTVQVFPADAALPGLSTCFETRPEGPLFSSLQEASRRYLHERGWTLAAAAAEPLRYKVGSRCVVGYRLHGTDGRRLDVIGKLYPDPAHAEQVHCRLERLHSQFSAGVAFLPRPLGVVRRLGLTLTEAVARGPDQPLGGAAVLSDAEIAWAGIALARLHTARLPRGSVAIWDGHHEGAQVQQRSARLAAWQSDQAAIVTHLGKVLAENLAELSAGQLAVCHGAFKRSQLVVGVERMAVTDFDALCLADPALDIGCFLAYLRPASLHRGRQQSRQWFETAGERFVHSYRSAAVAQGGTPSAVGQTLERARLFEASRLFKIAARRISRLNSPRPAELSIICGEISECLDRPARWTCGR